MCIYISQYRKEIFQSPHLLTQNGLSNLTRVPPIDAHPGTKKKIPRTDSSFYEEERKIY